MFIFVLAISLASFSLISNVGLAEAQPKGPPTAMPAREVPGRLKVAEHFNHTDMVPAGFMASVAANKSAAFHFKNLTLMVNCSRGLSLNLTAGSRVTMKYLSLSLDPSNSLQLEMVVNVTPPAGIPKPERHINFYLHVRPNSTVRMNATLALYINETALEGELGRDIDTSRLSWAYWNASQADWVAVESRINADGYLVANITHLSTWTILELPPQPPSMPIWMVYAAIGGLVVVVVALTAFYRLRRP